MLKRTDTAALVGRKKCDSGEKANLLSLNLSLVRMVRDVQWVLSVMIAGIVKRCYYRDVQFDSGVTAVVSGINNKVTLTRQLWMDDLCCRWRNMQFFWGERSAVLGNRYSCA